MSLCTATEEHNIGARRRATKGERRLWDAPRPTPTHHDTDQPVDRADTRPARRGRPLFGKYGRMHR